MSLCGLTDRSFVGFIELDELRHVADQQRHHDAQRGFDEAGECIEHGSELCLITMMPQMKPATLAASGT